MIDFMVFIDVKVALLIFICITINNNKIIIE